MRRDVSPLFLFELHLPERWDDRLDSRPIASDECQEHKHFCQTSARPGPLSGGVVKRSPELW